MKKLSNFSTLYRRLIKHRLILFQSLQAGVLMSAGDLIAQLLVEKQPQHKLDLTRTAQFGCIGIFLVGPAVSSWYKILAKGSYSTLKKVAMDQLIFAPTFLPVVIISINVIRRHSWDYIQVELKEKYLDIIMTNYKVWPLVQFLNFRFVPLKHQVFFVQSIAIFWNAYLSWKTQQ